MDYILIHIQLKKVAKMLKCSMRNISKLVEAEKLKPVKVLENGFFLFSREDVETFVKSKKFKQ